MLNVYGRLHFVEENKIVCLSKLLGEKALKSGHSIELCCADVLAQNTASSLAVLATFWVELNEHFCPCRHFGALFKISPTLHVELTNKLEALAPVAHCRLLERVISSAENKYWLIFEAGKSLSVYKLEKDCDDMTVLEGGFDEFPEVCLDEFAGAVTRSAMISSPKLKWCALGFDTGRVVLSVVDVESKIVHRKLIKFSGPVSVVMFVPEPLMQTPGLSDVGEVESTLEERFLVVSSTLGPVAIWRCLFEDGTLSWNNEILLSQSEQFDSITSACIISGNIAVGTYSGKILFYTSPCDFVSHEIASITQIHSPIVNMKVLDEKTLCVLSTAGLHTVKRSDL
ncbi:unnamed protein product [Heligmosomoides polygyrus]|uniref:Uncharacterized protein n=1 Tax=Heligmosomoides polygyrus TaxID=6339 RepID=A0A3P8BAU6_HELPZ|nr:unnamed protein product [Heligmosomoides polygyrus]